jgi:GNAT superfamily N-acetyltransferase
VDDRPIIRPRRADDVSALCEVLATQQPGSRYPHVWPLPFPVEQFIVREVEEQAWVADVGGRPVGHVAARGVVDRDEGIASRWAEAAGTGMDGLVCVSVLFVDRDLRRRGLGGALLDTAVRWGRNAGRVPVLDVVDHAGEAARFYRRRGWVEIGEARPSWLQDTEPPLLLMILPPDGKSTGPPRSTNRPTTGRDPLADP